jgi:hypothetical protein
MDVQKSKIKIDCAACGHNSVVKTAHKLATYILKNPPDILVGKNAKKDGENDEGPEEREVAEPKVNKGDKKDKTTRKTTKTKLVKKGEEENGVDNTEKWCPP